MILLENEFSHLKGVNKQLYLDISSMHHIHPWTAHKSLWFVFGSNACGREQTRSTVPICQRYLFFYLSPLFSTCKLTRTSPLGKLIKLLYGIVSRSTGFLAPIPIIVHLDRYGRIVQVLCKLPSYPAVLSLSTYPVFSPHIKKVISSWLEALKCSIQILPDRISLMGTPLSL